MAISAYTDGAVRVSNPGLASCAFVVYEDDGNMLTEIYREGKFLGDNFTNNQAEYLGICALLLWAEKNKLQRISIFTDSELVVRQVSGEYSSKPPLSNFRNTVYAMLTRGNHKLFHVKGHDGTSGNETADRICNEVLDEAQRTELR